MLDDEMDHIIREAADNHHPAYNDKAWEKMEQKLDKHLPQRKDRRKLVFFLFLFLLIGGSMFVAVNRFTANNSQLSEKRSAGNDPEKVTAPAQPANNGGSAEKIKQPAGEELAPVNTVQQTGGSEGNDKTNGQTVTNPVNDINATTAGGADSKTYPAKKNKYAGIGINLNNSGRYTARNVKRSKAGNGRRSIKITAPEASEEPATENELVNSAGKPRKGKNAGKLKGNVTAPVAEDSKESEEAVVSAEGGTKKQEENKEELKKNAEPVKDSVKTNKEDKNKDLVKTEEKPAKPADKKKEKKGFAGNFGITVSAGPDLSFIKLNNTGKVTMTYGAGLSYNIKNRLTVRAGFYASKKIYSASPDQYHTPGGNYPYLAAVDANCKVYEIPVSIAYNFAQRKKHNWFGNVGLSSFIMKKEDYTYNYKTPAGQSYNYYAEVNNQNKHYFAVLTLSAGYHYELSKRISFQAEPYVKLPLAGIGLGKINLNSSGLLFTVTVKPFAKGK